MIWGIVFFALLFLEGILMTLDTWWGLLFIAVSIWFCWHLCRPIYIDDFP